MSNLTQTVQETGKGVRVTIDRNISLNYVDVPKHVWDAVSTAIHSSKIDGREMPVSLCYVAVRAALAAYIGGAK